MSAPTIAQWAQWVVSALLLLSGVLALLAGWGLVRLRDFFQRMHPPALLTTGAAWCTTLACIVYFSALHQRLAPSTLLITIVLAISVPITSMLLARVALFRKRQRHNHSAMLAQASSPSPPPDAPQPPPSLP